MHHCFNPSNLGSSRWEAITQRYREFTPHLRNAPHKLMSQEITTKYHVEERMHVKQKKKKQRKLHNVKGQNTDRWKNTSR